MDAPEKLGRDSISMSSKAPSCPVSYMSPADPLGSPSLLPYRGTGAELRYPPVDPRKTRRYCTDFGLGQVEPAISSPPFLVADPSQLPSHHHLQIQTSLTTFADDDGSVTSCAGSTPLATYSHTGTDDDSDSDYSEYQDIEFEFPEPPSIKPALRRMQSSPMFTAEETSAVREFLKKRWGAKIKANARSSKAFRESNVQVLTPAKDDSDDDWDGRGHSDFSWEAVSPVRFSFEDESFNPRRPSREDRSTRDLEMAGEALLNVDHVSTEPTPRATRGLGYGIPLDNQDIPRGVADGCLGSADGRRRSKIIQSSVVPEPLSYRTKHASTSELSSKPEKAQTRYGRFTPSMPARIPQIIRKVSNLSLRRSRDDLRGEAKATVASSQQQQSYYSVLDNPKLAPVTPSAVDRLEVSMEKLKAHKPPRHAGSASVSFSPSVDAGRGDRSLPTRSNTIDRIIQTPPRQYQYVPGPSLASAGREKPSHRVNHSVPLAGLTNINVTSEPAGRLRSGSASARSVSVNININTNTTGATSGHKTFDPFLQRPTRSEPMGIVPSSHEMTRLDRTTSASAPMKSFMDMTPDQVRPESVAGLHKERMRKMLARASTGVFGWGKSLGRKKD